MSRIATLNESCSIKRYNEIYKKILISMECGGLGDVFIHRMIFEDIKKLMPESFVTFACQEKYLDAVCDHPYIDEVVDYKKVDVSNFLVQYSTGLVCTRHENKMAPFSTEHRSDIIADSIGLNLKNHNMHINLDEKYIIEAKNKLTKKPNFALCPISAISSKNITIEQIKAIKKKIDDLGGYLYCVHNKHIKEIEDLNIPIWTGLNIKQWMGSLSAADYVISVDTAAFHYSGGIGKPLCGIFSFVDGKVYGKYYNFTLVQKHRDNGNWDCGPCYNWTICPKSKCASKPCITELSNQEILDGIDTMILKHPIV